MVVSVVCVSFVAQICFRRELIKSENDLLLFEQVGFWKGHLLLHGVILLLSLVVVKSAVCVFII